MAENNKKIVDDLKMEMEVQQAQARKEMDECVM
jgi:hypothetical protein